MPAQLTFELFTDDEILFATKDAANDFFQNISIANATLTEFGVVKKAQLPAPLSGSVSAAYQQFDVYDDQGAPAQSYQIVTQQTIIDLLAKVVDLQAQLNNLREGLVNSGVAQ